jgi:spermidine synthase
VQVCRSPQFLPQKQAGVRWILPAPASYAEGKYYTSYFFQLLERHLSARGALVVQATSRATMPATFAIIERSLHSSGLMLAVYEAPVPLLGAVSFILATRQAFRPDARRLPQGLRLLDGPALARAFALGAGEPTSAQLSSLDHQRAVEAFHHEQSKLGN